MELILASGSPRRAKILKGQGYGFTIAKTDAPEASYPGDPARTVRENALAKARAARVANPSARIIAADTIVWMDGRIYGKPVDLDEARRFLRELSGRTHQVYTGVAVDDQARVFTSDVTFKQLGDALIEEYVRRVNPLDRAGAYDIDESGMLLIAGWRGSYENIMGLPLEALEMLRGCGKAQ